MAEIPPLDLGRVLHRLSRALIAYGVVGIVVAVIALGALVWVNGRIGDLRDEMATTIDQLATTTDDTATALADASTTAGSFSTTLRGAADGMPAVSGQIANLRTDLGSLEGQLRSVSLLGQSPLGSAADTVGRISTSLGDLDTQLSVLAVALSANSDALAANASSLRQLHDSTQVIATRLDSGVVEDSLGDVQLVVTVTLLAFTALSLVPAVGAPGGRGSFRSVMISGSSTLGRPSVSTESGPGHARRLRFSFLNGISRAAAPRAGGQRSSCLSADCAASIPLMPWTPPPGGVDEEHR
jgi:hypothetical protein